MKSAQVQYAEFHGRSPRGSTTVKLHRATHLVRLGRAVAIEYQTDKLHGGGDGKTAVYRHEFSAGDALYVDQTGKQLHILGPRLAVREEGIVN